MPDKPRPDPPVEICDPHIPPLDDEDDHIFLKADDPRRIEVERNRGVEPGMDS